MPLRMTRREGETWLDAARRYGEPWGLDDDIETYYHEFIRDGRSEELAAFDAVSEWDCLDLVDDDGSPMRTEIKLDDP